MTPNQLKALSNDQLKSTIRRYESNLEDKAFRLKHAELRRAVDIRYMEVQRRMLDGRMSTEFMAQ